MNTPDVVVRALRRSRLKVRILVALGRHGPLSVEEVAAALDTRPALVAWALHGRLPEYAPERALLPLRLVGTKRGSGAPRYGLTPAGRRIASDVRRRRWLYRMV